MKKALVRRNKTNKPPFLERMGRAEEIVRFRLWPYLMLPNNPFGRYRLMRKLADIKPGQNVVELGSGGLPHYMQFRTGAGDKGQLIASDRHFAVLKDSRRMERGITALERAAGKRKQKIQHTVLDAEHLPFRNESVDRVFASYSIAINFEEVFRVLKKGGKLIITGWFSGPGTKSLLEKKFGKDVEIHEGSARLFRHVEYHRWLVATKK